MPVVNLPFKFIRLVSDDPLRQSVVYLPFLFEGEIVHGWPKGRLLRLSLLNLMNHLLYG